MASQMQFSFVLMHILNNSWCDWECTGVLWCSSYKIHRKLHYHDREATSVL